MDNSAPAVDNSAPAVENLTTGLWGSKIAVSRPGTGRFIIFSRSACDPILSLLLLVGATITGAAAMNPNDKFQIIVNAFHNNRWGVSPTATRGAVESHAKKHGLEGADYVAALADAVAAGLVAQMADSSLTIRNAGRSMLPKR